VATIGQLKKRNLVHCRALACAGLAQANADRASCKWHVNQQFWRPSLMRRFFHLHLTSAARSNLLANHAQVRFRRNDVPHLVGECAIDTERIVATCGPLREKQSLLYLNACSCQSRLLTTFPTTAFDEGAKNRFWSGAACAHLSSSPSFAGRGISGLRPPAASSIFNPLHERREGVRVR